DADVIVTAGPSFTVTGMDASSCLAPFDGTITFSGLTNGEDYDLTYFDGGIVGPATFTANGAGEIIITGLAPGSYTNFLMDSLGCTTLVNTSINIVTPGSPTIGAGLDQTICEGQSVTLTANNPDVAIISWDNGVNDGISFTPGVGVVNYTVSGDLAGCVATDVVTVTVNAIPTVSITAAGPFAPTAGTQSLSASPAGGTWSSDCGACVNATTGVFDPAVAGVGTWNICYDAGVPPCDDQECIQIIVTGNCLLSGTVTGNDPTCFGFSDGSATISTVNATGNQTFVITDDLGTVMNVGNSNTANNLNGGWYYFNVTDEFPCNFVDSVFLNDPLQIVIDLQITDPLCFGVPTGLAVADTVFNYSGAYNLISYFWAPNPGGQNGIGEDSLENVAGGDYTLILNDENGCTETFDFTITYPDSLFLQELGADPAFCRLQGFQSGNGVIFAAASGGTPDYDYIWTNLQTLATSTNTTWGGLNPGDYQITVTDNNNCILQQTITLDSLNPIATYDIASPQFLTSGVCEGTAVVTVNLSNQSANYANPNNPNSDTTFFWNFDYDLANPSFGWLISHDVNEVFDTSYTSEGIYNICLVALNKNGCSDTTCKEIIVHDPLAFTAPNVFTPNGDLANDEFTFDFHAQAVAEFSCVIVDRWGQVIIEFMSITDSWNGENKNGKMCTDGVYFYTYKGVADDGTIIEGQGNIHLLGQ
ncbi:MAG: gliding motility-associated-like protein, partial [Arenicella sp.]